MINRLSLSSNVATAKNLFECDESKEHFFIVLALGGSVP